MEKRPPPGAASHISRDIVETVVKKKMAPSTPPPLPTGFKPKDISKLVSNTSPRTQSKLLFDSDDSSDDDNENNGGKYNRPVPKNRLNKLNEESKAQTQNHDSDSDEPPPQPKSEPKHRKSVDFSNVPSDNKEAVSTPKTDSPPPRFEAKMSEKNFNDSNDDSSKQKNSKISTPKIDIENKASNINKPKKDIIFNFSKFFSKTVKNRKLKSFLLTPIEKNVIVRCYIERNRFGTNMLGPVYTLCADLEDGTGQELMVCKKLMMSRTPHYVFSIMEDDLYKKRDIRSKLYLGKLRSTLPGEYILYSQIMDTTILDESNNIVNNIKVNSGRISESKMNETDDIEERSMNRHTTGNLSRSDSMQHDVTRRRGSTMSMSMFGLGSSDHQDDIYEEKYEGVSIRYNCTFRPAPPGVRGLEVCIPNPQPNPESPFLPVINLSDSFYKIRVAGKQNEMLEDECYIVNERKTRYDPLSSCLVDYQTRANMASVKNFQLVKSTPLRDRMDEYVDKPEDFLLQMGKTTEDCFNVDIRYPFSPFQAFAICISRFDVKLSWKDN